MKNNRSVKIKYTGEFILIGLAILIITVLLIPVSVFANGANTLLIKGIPVTGPNDVCGKPAWMILPPFPPDTRFSTLGIYNSSQNATDSLPLTADSCVKDAVLATHTDPMLIALAGYVDADSRVKNIPLREVSIKMLLDGTRSSLPGMESSIGNPFPPTKSNPNYPITVGDWFKAKGIMKIVCNQDGSSTVKAEFNNLIPNGVYSLTATWLAIPPGSTQPTFVPLAFGGVPSVIVPNDKGEAKLSRKLNYCPMVPTPDGSILMFVDLGYHMDGSSNGVFPTLITQRDKFISKNNEIFDSTKPPGIVTTPAVGFPINVEQYKNDMQ